VVNIFWFRGDLRLKDNAGLYRALTSNHPGLPIFIFDTDILNKLDEKTDARVQFIYDSVQRIKEELAGMDGTIKVFYDTPLNAFKELLKEYTVEKVFTNHDYESYATDRDNEVAAATYGRS
jgi:deoxyribodipyrimidine photo-lyase